jgi:hypothetical protein
MINIKKEIYVYNNVWANVRRDLWEPVSDNVRGSVWANVRDNIKDNVYNNIGHNVSRLVEQKAKEL